MADSIVVLTDTTSTVINSVDVASSTVITSAIQGPAGTNSIVTIAEEEPTTPTQGSLWWKPSTNILALYYILNSVGSWVSMSTGGSGEIILDGGAPDTNYTGLTIYDFGFSNTDYTGATLYDFGTQ